MYFFQVPDEYLDQFTDPDMHEDRKRVLGNIYIISSYIFTQLGYHQSWGGGGVYMNIALRRFLHNHGKYRNRSKPKAGTMPYSYLE